MTNFKNPNPDCEREDCKFICGGGTSTLVYYIPTYDNNGVNINPDRNTTTFTVECTVCNGMWRGATQLGETTYKEVEK